MKRAIIIVIVIILVALIITILPHLLIQSRIRNEDAATNALVRIYQAEMAFKATCNNRFATLQELIQAGLVDPQLFKDVRWYKVNVKVQSDKFELHATPLVYSPRRVGFDEKMGHYSFYINTDGIMRMGDHKGGEANQNDKSCWPSDVLPNGGKQVIDHELRPLKCP
ncbi:MAG: hypothetical protein HY819_02155 [Acidobacteria bacterium]|nr:hypothetical protein [Acidobacteriota bacterium]